MPQYSYYSNIKDHSSQVNITNILTIKMFEILLELSKRDTKWVNAVGKMVLIDLLNGGVATNLQFVKKKKKEKQTKNKQKNSDVQ